MVQKSGFDINSSNLLLWYRRYQRRKKYHAKPIFKLSETLDAATLLLLGVAKCEGEMSAKKNKRF